MIRPGKHHKDAGPTPDADDSAPVKHQDKNGHRGYGRWMMIACCVPMLAVAIALVATGVVGFGFVIIAVGCTVMMALMMRGMR